MCIVIKAVPPNLYLHTFVSRIRPDGLLSSRMSSSYSEKSWPLCTSALSIYHWQPTPEMSNRDGKGGWVIPRKDSTLPVETKLGSRCGEKLPFLYLASVFTWDSGSYPYFCVHIPVAVVQLRTVFWAISSSFLPRNGVSALDSKQFPGPCTV